MQQDILIGRGVPSRSHATSVAYAKRVRDLTNRCRAERGLTDADPLMRADFVAWLIARKCNWAPATWRLYKAAVVADLDAAIQRYRARTSVCAGTILEDADLIDLHAARRILGAEPQTGCTKATARTSAQKRKRLPSDERRRIGAELSKTRARYGPILADLLQAGVLTGLRPCEWPSARLLRGAGDGSFTLVVTNAKSDSERAHGPTRTLSFEGLHGQDVAALGRWISVAAACDGPTYRRLLDRLSDLLYRTTRTLWPRRKQHVSLYATRHEFAAMCKIVFSPEEVAALMGHASDVTATAHYGRCRSGTPSLPPDVAEALSRLPKPAPAEVSRVRRLLTDLQARMPSRSGSHNLSFYRSK